MSTSECRAKDPSTCPHHGAAQATTDELLTQAAVNGDFAAYLKARGEEPVSRASSCAGFTLSKLKTCMKLTGK